MSDEYTSILLEEIRDQNGAVLEAVGQMQEDMKGLAKLTDLQLVAEDVKIIKAVLTASSRDVADLNDRVNRLEQRA